MLMAAMRLNIPVVFVSGGPMEAGKVKSVAMKKAIDLVDAMIVAADDSFTDEEVAEYVRSACPNLWFMFSMFTAKSMKPFD